MALSSAEHWHVHRHTKDARNESARVGRLLRKVEACEQENERLEDENEELRREVGRAKNERRAA